MDAILLMMLANSLCNESTMMTGFGEKCVAVVEKYKPAEVIIPSKFGGIRTGGIKCHLGDKLTDGECVKTRIIVKR